MYSVQISPYIICRRSQWRYRYHCPLLTILSTTPTNKIKNEKKNIKMQRKLQSLIFILKGSNFARLLSTSDFWSRLVHILFCSFIHSPASIKCLITPLLKERLAHPYVKCKNLLTWHFIFHVYKKLNEHADIAMMTFLLFSTDFLSGSNSITSCYWVWITMKPLL